MNLRKTILSGHLFAYDELESGFRIVNNNKEFTVKEPLVFEGINEEEGRTFFDLKRTFINPLINPEIRLVRQDLRQAIITFIMTANNNQKRIKKMMDSLRELHPKRYLPEEFTEEQLRERGFGYRAKTLAATNKLLTHEFLEKVKDAEHEEQRELLLTLPGVGPKVADCIMAYSELASPYAFPQDIWVTRAMKRRHKLKSYSYEYVRKFAKKKFKEEASYVGHNYFLEEQTISKQTR